MSTSMLNLFESLTDPRREGGNHLYALNEIVFLTNLFTLELKHFLGLIGNFLGSPQAIG